MKSYRFKAVLDIIGINPFVEVPDHILKEIFCSAGKNKGPIPVRGAVNGKGYQQTMVKYKGDWRLYINTSMLNKSPERIGETIELTIEYDRSDRTITPHPKLTKALNENPEARTVFESMAPSLQREIIRYISSLKTEESIEKNVIRAINFLTGKGSFIGRDRL